jgi:ABC-type phosphate transport system substrate-binding protein
MRHRRVRNRIAASAMFAVAAMTMATTVGTGTAFAGNPPSPTLGTAPHWFTGKPEQIRSAGSDTTFFLTQTLANYFEQAGLYGCQLNSATTPNYNACLAAPNDVIGTTDVNDNYDHIEVIVGLGKIGSGDGQKQLCGNETAPFGGGEVNGGTAPSTVDYARSSKPIDTTQPCAADEVELGFAKDGVPAVDFPGAEGPGTATGSTTPWDGQIVGPVAAGWLPGNPVTCDTGAAGTSSNHLNTINSCSGVPVTNISNVGGTSSEAYDLWCNTGAGRITDWAQLTNLSGSETPGEGAKISGHPLPILIAAVNTGSGTLATFQSYVGCTLDTTNETTAPDICQGSQVIENNQAQFGDCAAADYPTSDPTYKADQAAEISSLFNFMSNGVFNSNIHSREVTLSSGVTYAAVKMTLNGVVPTTSPSGTLMNNTFPTARTLYNIYRTDTVRASTADFLNWICDSNNAFTKGVDNNTGQNYNNEITAAIQTTYGFIRLNSLTASPNNSCQLITSVAFPNE